MKLFLSWSGPRSREAALLFRDWLPNVIQAVDPWMSDVDIEKGAQWFAEISREVSASSFGIVFLTRENLQKPWLHFEAGALAKSLAVDGSSPRVAAYLLGIEPTDVLGPLKEFQHTRATEEDTLKLVASINSAVIAKGERGLKEERLKSLFSTLWASLGEPLKGAIAKQQQEKPRRQVQDMVEEILEYVRPRAQQRMQAETAAVSLERQFAHVKQTHGVLQTRLLDLEARYRHAEAARVELMSKADAPGGDGARIRGEIAAVDASIASLQAELARTRSEFILNEAKLMTFREELTEARQVASSF